MHALLNLDGCLLEKTQIDVLFGSMGENTEPRGELKFAAERSRACPKVPKRRAGPQALPPHRDQIIAPSDSFDRLTLDQRFRHNQGLQIQWLLPLAIRPPWCGCEKLARSSQRETPSNQ